MDLQQGRVHFLPHHQGSVRGVAFNPKHRYMFCSGAYDGHVNLYSAQGPKLIHSYAVTSGSLARNVNAVRFSSDGSQILATTTARRLVVVDVEKGALLLSYDNCAFNGRDRTGLAIDVQSTSLAATTCVNGKGICFFDLRMPLPLNVVYDSHSGIIRDIEFLHRSWPWGRDQLAVLTVGVDGLCKTTSLDGRCMHALDLGQPLNTVATTPEPYDSALDDGFSSHVVFGGRNVSAYLPGIGIQQVLTDNGEAPIWKARYNSNGIYLYTVCDRGVVRRYQRWQDRLELMSELYQHRADVEDMDISPYDEYIVTASKDRTVGIMRLGGPNHGPTECCEFT